MGGENSPACLSPDISTESSLMESPTSMVIGPLLPEMEKEHKERPYIYINLTTPPGLPNSASVTHPISPASASPMHLIMCLVMVDGKRTSEGQ